MQLLVVEDDPVIQKLLHRWLVSEGHDVDLVASGEDALARAGNGAYDAIVLDVSLPGIDGLEVARRLRAGTLALPILMLTGRDQVDDRLSGFAAGADDYLVKPFSLRELQARLLAVTRRPAQYTAEERRAAAELRQAIATGRLVLHYQPKLYLQTLVANRVEALVRWPATAARIWAPGELVALAERTNVIETLTTWILNEAMRQCRAWQEEGVHVGVAVNLSAHDVREPGTVERIGSLLSTHGIAPAELEVEITESSIMTDVAHSVQILARLHDMGVRISIDDFGTGYSSLSYLRRLPVDAIKIDQSFVKDMSRDEEALLLVRTMIELGHNLGLEVVAEGVEDLATFDALVQLNCDWVQGYFLSPPLPSDQFIQWLKERQQARRD